jgi:glycine oxidase
VIGGGVVGLAGAWLLREAGFHPVVVDPGEAPESATWAAGGMLAPLGEAREPGPFLELGLASLAEYPEFVARLEAASGIRVDLHLNGKLLTAAGPDHIARLKTRRDWLRADGHPVRWLDGSAVRALEPAISPDVEAGLFLEGNGRVHNRALLDALRAAVDRGGGRRITGRVAAIHLGAGRVQGVELADGRRLDAPWVVLAAGAWSGGIHGLPRELPVRPVKGQMLALSTPGRPIDRVVTSDDAYLIPRETESGPVVVVGATSENAGFDRSVDRPGQGALERGARALVPSLQTAPVVERWAGLRPGTPDDLPVLGPDPEVRGLWYLTGHYRNGVLLAPATARILRDGLTGNAAPPASFGPHRFQGRVLVTKRDED